jgi:hypothetical protein
VTTLKLRTTAFFLMLLLFASAKSFAVCESEQESMRNCRNDTTCSRAKDLYDICMASQTPTTCEMSCQALLGTVGPPMPSVQRNTLNARPRTTAATLRVPIS